MSYNIILYKISLGKWREREEQKKNMVTRVCKKHFSKIRTDSHCTCE